MDDREKEEEDKLGPLRPLPPSKSAPTMPLVKEPERVILRNKGDAGKSVPKSVSASTLTLLMPPPQLGDHVGRKQLTLFKYVFRSCLCANNVYMWHCEACDVNLQVVFNQSTQDEMLAWLLLLPYRLLAIFFLGF